jgi:Ca2+-binding RTX toxin-like protein
MSLVKLATLLSTMLVSLVYPVAARAEATCSYSVANRTVTVNATPQLPAPTLSDISGNLSVGSVDCGIATTANTDTVVVNDTSADGNMFFYIAPSVPFGPGFTNEAGSSDEIEFVVNFGAGGDDVFALDGRFQGSALNVVAGGNLINLNAGEGDGVDADVTINGVERFSVVGSDGNDIVSGQGGAGTLGPIAASLFIQGGHEGDDLLIGGDLQDWIIGDGGNDMLLGMGGPDAPVSGSAGNDVLNGGKGSDNFLDGGDGDDLIIGGSRADRAMGGLGNDILKGNKGKDRLFGQDGDDSLSGGPDRDRCSGGVGKDKVTSCEKGRA